MKLQIISLKLTNFKGFTDYEVNFDGKSASVFGDNATGKTTLYDSFMWLLFDKDSQGASSFGIKTCGSDGIEIPMIEHAVEGVIDVDYQRFTLKKVLREKWVKKRGRADREFEGHETAYEIDGVPKTKREYNDFIASIAPESLFLLATNTAYFNKVLTYQERRKMLLETFGGVSDAEVIECYPELADLVPLIEKTSVDDLRKVKDAECKRVNKELQAIPVQIQEAVKAIPNISENAEILMHEAKRMAGDIEELKTQLIAAMNGNGVQAVNLKIAEVDTAIAQMRARHAQSVPDVSAERKLIDELRTELGRLFPSDIVHLKNDEQRLVARSLSLSEEWKKIKVEKFTHDGTCPTCNQKYPENMLEVMEANFNRKKSVELERIAKEGIENGQELAVIRQRIADTEAANKIAMERKEAVEKEIAALEQAIIEKTDIPAFETLPEYHELTRRKSELQAEIEAIRKGGAVSVEPLEKEIEAKEELLKAVNQKITLLDAAATQKARVDELKQKQKLLAAQYEQAERIVNLVNLFERRRAESLDASISGEFSLVRWKLSEVLINGNINPTCVCTVNGVPYQDLNNAARIQAGCDIISTFCRKKGLSMPVFIDNAESITVIPGMDCQVIRLVVSEADKTLRVEI